MCNYITIIQHSVIFALHVTTDIVWGFSSWKLENEFANEQQCYVGTSLKTSYLDIYGCHRDQFPISPPPLFPRQNIKNEHYNVNTTSEAYMSSFLRQLQLLFEQWILSKFQCSLMKDSFDWFLFKISISLDSDQTLWFLLDHETFFHRWSFSILWQPC